MIELSLNQGKTALVDDEDYLPVSQFKWYAAITKGKWYVLSLTGHVHRKIHRFIMNAPPHLDVDHRDGNGLNNQRYNLRICARSGNSMNRSKPNNNTSGFKGVSWHKDRNRYQAAIGLNGRLIYLGLFSDPVEGARAYDLAAVQYHGEFAKTNVMLGLLPPLESDQSPSTPSLQTL